MRKSQNIDVCGWVPKPLGFVVLVSVLLPHVSSLEGGDYSETKNPTLVPLISNLIYGRLSNISITVTPEISQNLGFCVKNVKTDWNGAFDFSKRQEFIANCIKKTKGDLTQRLCTAAEINFYFTTFFDKTGKTTNFQKPTKNCNLTTWLDGCEPGWGCNLDKGQRVDLKDGSKIPSRTQDCQPCCEGFFCPKGLTCMISCPLGSYCPLAKLNESTGFCEPYDYQVPPGKQNHTCGGADTWADVTSGPKMFCSPGSYCPTTIQKNSCTSRHFCRTGSTAQSSCFKLASCPANAENQNIRGYGIMLFVGLTLLLLIVYNCSDQVLSTRERRNAKSREAAAKHARETAQAQERWKAAKDVAKKGKAGLSQQLSRTFSRAKSSKPPDPTGLKANEPKMMDPTEDKPEQFTLPTTDKHGKKQPPRGKQLHTHSQMFKYAYGQIEKEKAMEQENQDMTFSGVISMATHEDMRSRPVIEIAFKDLTLTLKGKSKHLLRSVSGKLVPGRVSAVMGPSGAGKTTFLSALTGKASGCYITGQILINGKNEHIQSYKKIIGFVPQDDIVHGNLTVEENLRFNARCRYAYSLIPHGLSVRLDHIITSCISLVHVHNVPRLSADMPKQEKVLVIERVIESLGLQAIRDSLVGTVEKRGISGGQRKRVNVGIEMVMEPSLLILDEPTSGLDSSSSQLLLRALRREAVEGVNISMVIHQPSYTLFKMFDDLILLAKGGMTVYHGPVKKVEEYFSGIGITVPDRVNPPDHYIDILEGILKPDGVTREQLPVRWMLHNGYSIPSDLLHLADGLSDSSAGLTHSSSGDQSFAGDLWQDVKSSASSQKDQIQRNVAHARDLSNRRTPGVARQFRYFIGRVSKQRLREAKTQFVDYLILLIAGACLGTLAKVDDQTFGSLGYTYTIIAISLLCMIAALRSFSLDKLHYWRESASGISSLAYFLSKDTLDHFNTIIKPVVYLSMYYFFNNPRSTFQDNYVILLCLVYCVTGAAYVFAILLEPSPAQLWSVLVPVVLTLMANQEKDSPVVKYFGNFCYPKWALEAFIIANAERYAGVWLITRCSVLMESGYDINDWTMCLVILIAYGIVFRVIAYFALVTFQKK